MLQVFPGVQNEAGFIGTQAAPAPVDENPSGAVSQVGGQITRMVTSFFTTAAWFTARSGNNSLRPWFILALAMPALPAQPVAVNSHRTTTVVRADPKTGRLVRSMVLLSQASSGPMTPEQAADLDKMVDRIAGEQGVESPLVHSVIRAESNYNPNAISPKGAQGLMQLIPQTAKRFGVSDAFDAQENVEGGVKYLRFLLDYYEGDYPKAIAAYNAGEAAVDKYKGIPPYAETRNYVYRVAKNLRAARNRKVEATQAPVMAGGDVAGGENKETGKPIQASLGSDGRVYYRTP